MSNYMHAEVYQRMTQTGCDWDAAFAYYKEHAVTIIAESDARERSRRYAASLAQTEAKRAKDVANAVRGVVKAQQSDDAALDADACAGEVKRPTASKESLDWRYDTSLSYRSGYNTGLRGGESCVNPYPIGGNLAMNWDAGYLAGIEKRQKSMQEAASLSQSSQNTTDETTRRLEYLWQCRANAKRQSPPAVDALPQQRHAPFPAPALAGRVMQIGIRHVAITIEPGIAETAPPA